MNMSDESTPRRSLRGDLPPEAGVTVEGVPETHPEASAAQRVSAVKAGLLAEPTRTASNADASELTGGGGPDDVTALLAPAQGPGEIGRLGDFRILRILGRGGMGVVFEAQDVKLGRHVAVKAMLPKVAADPLAKARFLREAQAAAAVEHDHVVPIHLIDDKTGVPFLVMPFLKGESLDDRLKRDGTLPIAEVMRIGREVAEGLSAAHERGLVHRDIKPGNLWLEAPRGRVKILDFGLARALTPSAAGAEITQSGAVVGTPAYMSPEQGRGLPVDYRTDLFSLGGVLYRACTGHQPFQGSDAASVLMALAADTPADPRLLNPTVPASLASTIRQLLEKDPAKRPQSAQEVARLLAPTVEPLAAERDSADETAVIPALPMSEPRRRRIRHWTMVVAAVMLAGITSLFAPTIIRIATNKGELVIEADDPNIEVLVKPDAAHVVMDKGKTSEREFVLKAGNYEFEVFDPQSGAKSYSRKFEITRGGTTRLTATMNEIASARPKPGVGPGPAIDRDRRAAELLHQYANLDLRLADGKQVTVKRTDPLLVDAFKITGIDVAPAEGYKPYPQPLYTDILLPAIEGLTELTSLYTHGYPTAPTEDEALRLIRQAQWTDLRLNAPPTPQVLAALKRLPNLTKLALEGRTFDDALLAALVADFPRLTFLGLHRLGQSGKVTATGLANLKRLPLREVALAGSPLVNRDLCRMLAEAPALENLAIFQSNVDDEGLRELAKAPKLWVLGLDFTAITDTGLAHLAGLRTLQILNVRGSKVSEAGVKKLATALPACHIESDFGVFDLKKSPTQWTGNKPPPKDLFPGELTVYEMFDGTGPLPTPTFGERQVRPRREGGVLTTDLPAGKPGTFAVYHFGAPEAHLGFATRVRAHKDTWAYVVFQLREAESRSTWLVVEVSPEGQWVLRRVADENVSGKWVLKPDVVLARSMAPDPALTAGKWVPIRGRSSGSVTEVWVGSNGHARVDEPGDPGAGLNRRRPFGIGGKVGIDGTGFDIDSVAVWRLPTSTALPSPAVLTAEQRPSLEWVLSVGGRLAIYVDGKVTTVAPGDQLPDKPFTVSTVNLGVAKSMAGFEKLKECPNVIDNVFLGPTAGDGVLSRLVTYPGIAHTAKLHLEGPDFGDAGLAQLKKFTRLTDLTLTRTSVTAKGLTQLNDLKISGLTLRDSKQIDDEVVSSLPKLPGLTRLWLDGTSITDTGLERLADVKKLNFLVVRKTKVTKAGVEKLAAALPACKIEYDDGVFGPK
jgi:eukaryotic-like serine/threonine-protein kinase